MTRKVDKRGCRGRGLTHGVLTPEKLRAEAAACTNRRGAPRVIALLDRRMRCLVVTSNARRR